MTLLGGLPAGLLKIPPERAEILEKGWFSARGCCREGGEGAQGGFLSPPAPVLRQRLFPGLIPGQLRVSEE